MTVGQLAKMFGLSRTALLYYHRTGLLVPSGRTQNGYRQYSEADAERLRQIVILRDAGVPLDNISAYLDAKSGEVASVLLKRLDEINAEIAKCREQQSVIIRLLGQSGLQQKRLCDKAAWQKVLAEAGLDEDAALGWHISFESQSPEQHESLLATLGFTPEEKARFKEKLYKNKPEYPAK